MSSPYAPDDPSDAGVQPDQPNPEILPDEELERLADQVEDHWDEGGAEVNPDEGDGP